MNTSINKALVPYEATSNELVPVQKIVSGEYIAGILQTDGSFFISVIRKKDMKWGLQQRPECVITLDNRPEFKGRELLEAINAFIGNSGKIYLSHGRDAQALVFGKKALIDKVLPQVERHPMYGNKALTIAAIIKVIELTTNQSHHDEKIMASILLTIFRVNESSQRTEVDLKDWFSHLPTPSLIKSAESLSLTPIYRESITDDFLIGLIEGDGCFGVGFRANAKIEVFSILLNL